MERTSGWVHFIQYCRRRRRRLPSSASRLFTEISIETWLDNPPPPPHKPPTHTLYMDLEHTMQCRLLTYPFSSSPWSVCRWISVFSTSTTHKPPPPPPTNRRHNQDDTICRCSTMMMLMMMLSIINRVNWCAIPETPEWELTSHSRLCAARNYMYSLNQFITHSHTSRWSIFGFSLNIQTHKTYVYIYI